VIQHRKGKTGSDGAPRKRPGKYQSPLMRQGAQRRKATSPKKPTERKSETTAREKKVTKPTELDLRKNKKISRGQRRPQHEVDAVTAPRRNHSRRENERTVKPPTSTQKGSEENRPNWTELRRKSENATPVLSGAL